MSINVYVVTSTIVTGIGHIDPQTRFYETIETIKSIRKQDKNSYVLLIDNSLSKLPDAEENLISSMSDYYLYVGDRKQCIEFNKNGVRSAGEAFILLVSFDVIRNEIRNEVNRIFKVSGRYRLTESFDPSEYDSFKGKYCFKSREENKRHDETTCFLHTRLWSFCYTLLDDANDLLRKSLKTIFEKNVNIEEAMFFNINKNLIAEKDVLHCEGILAMWNEKVSE
jgi:hypothetical protein